MYKRADFFYDDFDILSVVQTFTFSESNSTDRQNNIKSISFWNIYHCIQISKAKEKYSFFLFQTYKIILQ